MSTAKQFNLFRYIFCYDNFGIVTKEKIYRSGTLLPFQFNAVIKKYKIKTVLRLSNFELKKFNVHQIQCIYRENNIYEMPLVMPGDGVADFNLYNRAVEILQTKDYHPLWVFCARGVHRTGAVIAAYRVCVQKWSFSEALNEMKKYKFKIKRNRFNGENHPLASHLINYFNVYSPGQQPDNFIKSNV
jgi:protein tyrosine/serine phosphatase